MLEGVLDAIEDGWFQNEIADAAYAFQKSVASGDFVTVGIDAYVDGDDSVTPILYIDEAVEDEQLARLQEVKRNRNDRDVQQALREIATVAADPTINLMPALLSAATARCTVGEQMDAMESVFGTWTEPSLS